MPLHLHPPTRRIESKGMTLVELRASFPGMFYRQDWFRNERFMNYYPSSDCPLPTVGRVGCVPERTERLPRAVDLAHAYLASPDDPRWRHFWWCADVDGLGQRIYVGGVSPLNGHKFEVHRHLHISDNWVIAA